MSVCILKTFPTARKTYNSLAQFLNTNGPSVGTSIDGQQMSFLETQISSALILGSKLQLRSSVNLTAVEDIVANTVGSFARCVEHAIRESELRYTAIAGCNEAEEVVGLVVRVEESG